MTTTYELVCPSNPVVGFGLWTMNDPMHKPPMFAQPVHFDNEDAATKAAGVLDSWGKRLGGYTGWRIGDAPAGNWFTNPSAAVESGIGSQPASKYCVLIDGEPWRWEGHHEGGGVPGWGFWVAGWYTSGGGLVGALPTSGLDDAAALAAALNECLPDGTFLGRKFWPGISPKT
ncbi:MAG: hypothetical protein OXF62_17780 [Caldilineaceae bacterium]|nr:hypothetical protein [Caldilineaceae bacterium]